MTSQIPLQNTADLGDIYTEDLRSCDLQFRDFGAQVRFAGQIATVRCFEDNAIVRETLSQPGHGRVLVVDGGGSQHMALMGDNIAELAVTNGWAGVVIHGCVRDSAELAEMDLGIKALGTNPRKSRKEGLGVAGKTVQFGGVTFTPGEYLYADADGVVVVETPAE